LGNHAPPPTWEIYWNAEDCAEATNGQAFICALGQQRIPWTTTTEFSSFECGKGDVVGFVVYHSKTVICHLYHSFTMSQISMVV
jgi:hypothetical protein